MVIDLGGDKILNIKATNPCLFLYTFEVANQGEGCFQNFAIDCSVQFIIILPAWPVKLKN